MSAALDLKLPLAVASWHPCTEAPQPHETAIIATPSGLDGDEEIGVLLMPEVHVYVRMVGGWRFVSEKTGEPISDAVRYWWMREADLIAPLKVLL